MPDQPIRRKRMTAERWVELLTTALDVMREVGYEAMTMEAVAVRARCSKATLYRIWRGKPQMIVAALYATRRVDIGAIDTGTLRGDLLALCGQLVADVQRDTELLAALAHAVLIDPELASAMRTSLVEPESAALDGFVERAVRRGELTARPAAVEFLPQLLFVALMARPLTEGAFLDMDYATRYIDLAIMPALLADRPVVPPAFES
ncbi:TetR/AcrR family transcriptional regulator [Streptomyces sasae]|uniref:TetR/AcrR family transcriptional regulator n=1 Tax=Streptomyces sasae TaxID=1266772 RepID=UPI00292DB29E|nr:TetR/AcrR family transcriptional regulator [Streptomyces sasae]